MAEEKKESGGLMAAVPVTAMLAILAGLFLSSSLPYQDERPSVRPLQAHYTAAQDVEARLWQDPFAAIDGISNDMEKDECKSSNAEVDKNTQTQAHDKKRIYCNQRSNKNITIFAITLSGGSYQESAEQRMRRRYAVLSALINQGFAPQDEQHIGYFQTESEINLQKRVPFEWWSFAQKDKERKLLLLWVDESSLLECPAAKLKKLLLEASPDNTPNQIPSISYAVIGPNTSTVLRDMLKEVERNTPDICSDSANKALGKINGQNIVYFSAGATASDNKLLEELQTDTVSSLEAGQIIPETDETVSSYFNKEDVKLYRTTATDNVMMIRLMEELKLRHIDKEDHVVILSEGDTFYGRAMPEAFNEKWDAAWGKDDNNKTIHIYSYMRGLDGKLPDKDSKTANSVEKKSDSKDKSGVNASIELPEGQNQKDYLRRMAANIFELHQSLKNGEDKNGKKKGIAAIGVLGSDVHDKLMILEALRQHFPHKLFFTTDLDAIYSHSSKLPQTHNLIVVSPFDLVLRHELQDKIPPFRDSYQTAFFLATQMALKYEQSIADDWVDKFKLPPRLFEIGRSRPIPLPASKEGTVSPTYKDDDCSWADWQKCNNIVQPPIVTTSPFTLASKVVWVVVLTTISLPLVISWRVRESVSKCKSDTYVMVLLWLWLLVRLTMQMWPSYNEEPFYWHEGVSIWFSQLLRLSVLLFAVGFFFWGRKQIKAMQDELQKIMSSVPNGESIFALPVRPVSLDLATRSSSLVAGWNLFFVGSWKKTSDLQVNPDDLWKTYLDYYYCVWKKFRFFSGSVLRAVTHGVAFFLMAFLLICQTGFPNVPARGGFAFGMNGVIIFIAVLATIFLTMWVVQNARLCERLITRLSEKPSQWNEIARRWAIRKNKVAPECVEDWLDIQLVVRLTKTIQPLIWGPVVCVVLLVLARSPIIDDWDIPWGLEIVFIAMLLYAISAEIFLQQGAKRARTKAIDQLSRKIRGLRNKETPNEVIIKRIEAEIERIRMLREGAFRPWYEWPLLQSFGGVGTLVFMLQYFAGVWENGTF